MITNEHSITLCVLDVLVERKTNSRMGSVWVKIVYHYFEKYAGNVAHMYILFSRTQDNFIGLVNK